MNRKQRRTSNKQMGAKATEKISDKISQFQNLSDECLACTKPFDKKDKQMAATWNVVVREDKGAVRLYCPDCWEKAKNVVRETLKEEQ